MPVYNFEKNEPGKETVHLDPLQLADDEQAWDEAVVACGQMVKDMGGEMPKGSEFVLRVADEEHSPIFAVKVSSEAHR